MEYYLSHWHADHMNAPISSSYLCPGVRPFHGVRTEREAGQRDGVNRKSLHRDISRKLVPGSHGWEGPDIPCQC